MLARKFAALSLRTRLSVGLIAIMLSTTLGLTTAALVMVKRTMQESIAQEQFARISAIANAVDQKFISRRNLLRTFAISVETAEIRDNTLLQSFLVAHYAPLKASFDNVAFLDSKGNLVANLTGTQQIGKLNVADRAYFSDTVSQHAGVISKPFRNRVTGLAQITITQPVMNSRGEVRWVISGFMNLQEDNFLGELAKIKFGKSGYMFITNTDGIVIDHPRKGRILKHSDAEGGKNEATRRAIAGFEGTTEAMNRIGVYGLYAFKQISQTNWIIGSIYPRDENFQEIDRIERLAWIAAIILTLLVGGITLAVLQTQLSPLSRLHVHMQRTREMVDYDRFPEGPSPPEIRDMALTFDALMLERDLAQEQLKSREAHVRSILTHAPDAFVSIDHVGNISEWNRQAEATFGWSRAEMIGKSVAQTLVPSAMRGAHSAGFAKFAKTGTGNIIDRRVEVLALHKEGNEIPVEISVASIKQGDTYIANAFLRDITDRLKAQSELAASEKRVRDIADHIPALIGHFTVDLKMSFMNERAKHLFKIESGRDYDLRSAIGQESFLQHEPYVAKVLCGEQVSFEFPSLRIEGNFLQANLVPDLGEHGEVRGFYIMTFDVSELKKAERKLLELSNTDTLTQLPNRRRFNENLEDALNRTKRDGKAMALMYLDLDSFKQINDVHGHSVGDEVLIMFARRLLTAVRSTDTVARLAGDEFVIILEGLREASEASIVASKIVADMQIPMRLELMQLSVTSSIGVAVIDANGPNDDGDPGREGQYNAADLIALADSALYSAKRAGRNTFHIEHM